jgi:hypothetical protein
LSTSTALPGSLIPARDPNAPPALPSDDDLERPAPTDSQKPEDPVQIE